MWEERIVKVMTVTGKQNKMEQVFTKARKYQTNSIGFFDRVINQLDKEGKSGCLDLNKIAGEEPCIDLYFLHGEV